MTFPEAVEHKLLQTEQFGSPEWEAVYSHDRSAMEGQNGFLKDGAQEDIENGARRRLRGYASQFLLVCLQVAASNLRRIDGWLRELSKHASAEERETYFRRKRQKRYKRKLGAAARKNAWDNIKEQEEARAAKLDPDDFEAPLEPGSDTNAAIL